MSDGRTKQNVNDNTIGLDFLEKLKTVNYTKINPADWPFGLRPSQYTNREHQELVSPAVEAADEVWEDVVVQEARAAVEEETREEVHPAVEEVKELRVTQQACDEEWEETVHPAEAEETEERVVQEARPAVEEETREEVHAAVEEVTEEVTIPAEEAEYEDRVVQEARDEITEERVTQEAREEIKGERHKHTEEEVTETVTREEIVEVDGKWAKKQISEEVTRIERTPVYEECDLYNEDGSLCTCCVQEAVEAYCYELLFHAGHGRDPY